MSIYSKSLDDLTTADLSELLNEGAIENIRLEFKRDIPEKYKLLKELSGFANTYGGWLIIGAEEAGDGKLSGFPGVEKKSSYKQTLVQYTFEGISPPIEISVSEPIPTPDNSNRFCYVVYTPESALAPHFINNRRGVYIRANEHNQKIEPKLATYAEIQHLSERRKTLIERREMLIKRSKTRFLSFVETSYEESEKTKHRKSTGKIGASYILTVSPTYTAEKLVDQIELMAFVKNKHISWRGTNFPLQYAGIISQFESVLVLEAGSNFSLLDINIWGQTSFMSELTEPDGEGLNVHSRNFMGNLLVSTLYAKEVLIKGRYQGPVLITLELLNVRGLQWLDFQGPRTIHGPTSKLDNHAIIEIATDTASLEEKLDDVIKDILSELFFALNWASSADTPDKIERWMIIGYVYNLWRRH